MLDPDWLRVVWFKCNTSEKSVTQVQIVILDNDWLKTMNFFKTLISPKSDEKFMRKLL